MSHFLIRAGMSFGFVSSLMLAACVSTSGDTPGTGGTPGGTGGTPGGTGGTGNVGSPIDPGGGDPDDHRDLADSLSCTPPSLAINLGAQLVDAFPKISIPNPVSMTRCGEDQPWMVVSQRGFIVSFEDSPDAESRVILDIQEEVIALDDFGNTSHYEAGMLGLVCDPDYEQNKYVYFTYTSALEGIALRLHLVRVPIEQDGTIDRAKFQDVWTADFTNEFHHGGGLAFDNSGDLFLTVGDATRPFRVQELDNPYGKLLKFDAKNNNFVPEVYALGFRNPWSIHYDESRNAFWVGDVGENRWEEINLVSQGQNFGWPFYEGLECKSGDCSDAPDDLIEPYVVYPHPDVDHGLPDDELDNTGVASVSGPVYKGSLFPELIGQPIFGDFLGKVFTAYGEAGQVEQTMLVDVGALLSAFAEDAEGEVIVLAYGRGKIERMVPQTAPDDAPAPPELLSELDCFAFPPDSEAPVAASTLMFYEVSQELWSDAAAKRRWVQLPEDSLGDVSLAPSGRIDLPAGSTLVKEFSRDDALLETRFFKQDPESRQWSGYTFDWEGTDAVLLTTGKNETDTNWKIPSRLDCLTCHNDAENRALGLQIQQIVPDDDPYSLYQFLKEAFPDEVAASTTWPTFGSGSGDIDAQVRAYLHSNCSHCHSLDSQLNRAGIDLRYVDEEGKTIPIQGMSICDKLPNTDFKGQTPEDRVLVGGSPERSILYQRVSADGSKDYRMPPLGTDDPDETFVSVLREWIESDPCN